MKHPHPTWFAMFIWQAKYILWASTLHVGGAHPPPTSTPCGCYAADDCQRQPICNPSFKNPVHRPECISIIKTDDYSCLFNYNNATGLTRAGMSVTWQSVSSITGAGVRARCIRTVMGTWTSSSITSTFINFWEVIITVKQETFEEENFSNWWKVRNSWRKLSWVTWCHQLATCGCDRRFHGENFRG